MVVGVAITWIAPGQLVTVSVDAGTVTIDAGSFPLPTLA
jgi:hypothetical protein